MNTVWDACIHQAHEMLEHWKGMPDVRSTGKDVHRFSLHVLTATGFGKSYPFDPKKEEILPDGQLSYKASLGLILENLILIMFLGPKFLTGALQHFLPEQWALVGRATQTFKKHIAQIIDDEKVRLARVERSTDNFISAIVHASEDNRSKDGHVTSGLSESEIYGNIFVFNFAGHDSISITLTYLITHLAAHPEIQDWIAEEIDEFCPDHAHGDPTSYREIFAQLKRCTAVVVRLTLAE